MIGLKNKWIIGIIVSAFALGACEPTNKNSRKELAGNEDYSISLEKVINDKHSPAFACSFGHFEVQMVPSKYTDHKYFKVKGTGVLVNSGWVHTNTGSNSDIIYAVPQSSPIKQGSALSAYCISQKYVPYEGKERENIDKKAALVEFAMVESE